MNPSQAVMSGRYVVISADGHCGADVWGYRPYLEARYREEFDGWARGYQDGWAALQEDAGYRGLGAASFASSYNWDSARRMSVLEDQGIAAEVLFPNTAPPFYPSGAITAPAPRTAREYELRFAGVKAAQPLAGRVLRRGTRSPGRHRAGLPPRRVGSRRGDPLGP